MRNRIWMLGGVAALALAAACGDDESGGPGAVAFLGDSVLFDYRPTMTGAEASNLEHTLLSYGLQVTRIVKVDSAGLDSVLATHRVLVIPEAFANFDDSLKTGAQALIRNWVDSSGGLLIINPNTTNRAVLDSLFNYALATGANTDDRSLLQATASGTAFAGGPSVIWDNSAVTFLSSASLPAGAVTIYAGPNADVTVVLIPQGAGAVVLIGWDWFDAAPFGLNDGGWLEVLERALRS